jgi:hypothetical protein
MAASCIGPRCLALLLAATVLAASTRAAKAVSLDAVLACRSIEDAMARLACFDQTTNSSAAMPPANGESRDRLPPAVGAEPAPVAAPVAQAPPGSVARAAVAPTPGHPAQPLDSEQQFGMRTKDVAAAEVAAGVRAPEIKNIQAAIVAIGRSASGRLLFTLDNGQVWRQLLADGDLLAKVGDSVTISRGLFGSFWLEASSGRGCKVNRVD